MKMSSSGRLRSKSLARNRSFNTFIFPCVLSDLCSRESPLTEQLFSSSSDRTLMAPHHCPVISQDDGRAWRGHAECLPQTVTICQTAKVSKEVRTGSVTSCPLVTYRATYTFAWNNCGTIHPGRNGGGSRFLKGCLGYSHGTHVLSRSCAWRVLPMGRGTVPLQAFPRHPLI